MSKFLYHWFGLHIPQRYIFLPQSSSARAAQLHSSLKILVLANLLSLNAVLELQQSEVKRLSMNYLRRMTSKEIKI